MWSQKLYDGKFMCTPFQNQNTPTLDQIPFVTMIEPIYSDCFSSFQSDNCGHLLLAVAVAL